LDSSGGCRLVLFDFDGTLADSFPWFLNVINQVAIRYRFRTVAHHEVEGLRGLGSRELIRHLGIPWWKVPLIARHLRRLAAEETGKVMPFGGVPEMLERLSRHGMHLGLVTSNSRRKVEKVLGSRSASLFSDFEYDVGVFAKRRALRRILARNATQAGRAVYIGDETRDAEAAHALGIPFAAVGWGFAKPETLRASGACHVFEGVEAIPRYLLGF
jgi:phosphoglycolate phosphatase